MLHIYKNTYDQRSHTVDLFCRVSVHSLSFRSFLVARTDPSSRLVAISSSINKRHHHTYCATWWRSSELLVNRCGNGRTPRIGHGTQWRQRMRVDGVDTCEAAATKLTAASIAGFAISDGCLSRTTSAGGPADCFDSCSAAARSGCADVSRDRNLAYAGSGHASGTTPARREHKSGGYATAWKTRVLRPQHGLEGLERCLQKLRVCLFCTAWLTLGAVGEISGTDAQRDADTGRSVVHDTAVLHAGDVVQRDCTNTSGECWSTGGPGGMEVLGPTSRTDLTDTQCGSAARALELQLRGRDSVSNGTVRPRHRRLSESKRRDLPREHPYRRYSTHAAGWTTETTPCPQQCSVDVV